MKRWSSKKIEIAGEFFGRLTVVDRSENIGTHTAWNCLCSCGGTIAVRTNSLRRGATKSCGCLQTEAAFKHGASRTKLYGVWRDMKSRCSSATHHAFAHYGGRGITVCEGWAKFKPFRDWALSAGYAEGLSIDRIDNDSGYSPLNCRWATKSTQATNRRTSILSEADRERLITRYREGARNRDLMEEFGVGCGTVTILTKPYRRPRAGVPNGPRR